MRKSAYYVKSWFFGSWIVRAYEPPTGSCFEVKHAWVPLGEDAYEVCHRLNLGLEAERNK